MENRNDVMVPCPTCGGEGEGFEDKFSHTSGHYTIPVPCETCETTGEVPIPKCLAGAFGGDAEAVYDAVDAAEAIHHGREDGTIELSDLAYWKFKTTGPECPPFAEELSILELCALWNLYEFGTYEAIEDNRPEVW